MAILLRYLKLPASLALGSQAKLPLSTLSIAARIFPSDQKYPCKDADWPVDNGAAQRFP